MLAHIEWLERGRFGVVRAGPQCGRMMKPYGYSAAFVRPKYGPNKAKVLALTADGKFKTAHRRAIIAALSRFFIGARWDRCKPWGMMKINS